MKLLLPLFCFVSISIGFSQSKSLLYEVKKDGFQTTYLYGTIHLIPDSLFLFTKKLKKIISQSDEMIFEITDFSDNESLTKMLKSESNSFDIFSKVQQDSVLNWGAQLIESDTASFRRIFEYLKPINLLQLPTMKALQEHAVSVDLALMKFADEKGIVKSELETVAFQLELLNDLPDSVMAEMILSAMRQSKDSDQLQAKLLHLYQTQDIEGLANLLNESDETSAFLDDLIGKRNKKWLPIIIDKSKTKSCFVAVGAGHLSGKDGLISLFQQAGFIVSPITF
jgi:uncharacterized protein YbaP (TraB family)